MSPPRLHGARYLPALFLFLVLLVLLQVGLPALGVPHYLLPTPSRVWARLTEPGSGLAAHLWATAQAGVGGLLLGSVGGVALAILFVAIRPLERAFYPWVLVSQTLPSAALAPLLVIWLGNGLAPRLAMAALFAFFPVLVNTTQGLRQITPEQRDLLRAWGASSVQTFRLLRIPAALPALFAGLRIAATLAVVGAIVGELAGSSEGLGYVISIATYHLQTDRVFAAVVLASGLSLLLSVLLHIAERQIVFWHTEG
ncbi:ABC transporter permease [Candidatus Oscillochloris fontis]|uniref:ABC transporter permease n=1 Tax=Candidatus Oscillochloris fontis TaxID=2496868 RepID=UPI001EE820DE|nr:ABC transporter permease [Candidatus Oscillochloris fontis]